MRSSHSLDRVEAAFDDDRLVADAGLLLPATLAHHLGLKELVERHLDLGAKPGRANAGDKLLTLVMSASPTATASPTRTPCARAAPAASSFPRQGRLDPGHLPAQLPLGPRLPARPGEPRAACPRLVGRRRTRRRPPHDRSRLDDLRDVRARQGGATRFTHTGVRGYHPLLAIAAGTGDVLMAHLRGGNANRGRSAGHFLRETIGRVRSAGAGGALTVRADSAFDSHAVVAACRALGVRFRITIRRHRSVRRLIEAIPDVAWQPIPYWIAGGADVAETTYTPFAAEKDAVPVRLIVRRVRPAPGSKLALLTR